MHHRKSFCGLGPQGIFGRPLCSRKSQKPGIVNHIELRTALRWIPLDNAQDLFDIFAHQTGTKQNFFGGPKDAGVCIAIDSL